MISTMLKKSRENCILGHCAHCNNIVYESRFTLDDSYNVWVGKCPYCGALNYLSLNHGLRGYSSQEMFLVLPTPEEVEANKLPEGIPLALSTGVPATIHGSNLGEFLHKFKKNPEDVF